jgi:uncharacterized protein YaaQ
MVHVASTVMKGEERKHVEKILHRISHKECKMREQYMERGEQAKAGKALGLQSFAMKNK